VKKVRIVKVLVQPVVVIDDGETIEEFDHPVMAIPAAEWPTYSSERFPREVTEWEQRLNQEKADGDEYSEKDPRR
jgi:hypothetical protein